LKKIKYSNTKRRNIFKRIIRSLWVPNYHGQDFLVVFDWFILVHLGLRGVLCWWDKTQKVNWLGNKSEHKSTFTLAFWDKITKNVQSRVLLSKSHCCQYSRFNALAHYEFLMIVDLELHKWIEQKLPLGYSVRSTSILFSKSCCCLEQDGLDIPSYENVHWSNFDHLGC